MSSALGHLLGIPNLRGIGGAGETLPAGYAYYVDGNGDYYVDENGDYYVVYDGSGNWWDSGTAADAYGGEFESGLDASFLVIEGVYSNGGSYDQWESLQSDSNTLRTPSAGLTSRASGATEIVGGAGGALDANNHAGLDGGTGNDQVFMLWTGNTVSSVGVAIQHQATNGFVSIDRSGSGGDFIVQLSVRNTTTEVLDTYNIGYSAGIVSMAAWVTQTTYKLWVNGELVRSGTHSKSFTLEEGSTTRSAVNASAPIAASGWGYSEPSDVPAMQRAVTKYWQDGSAHDPS